MSRVFKITGNSFTKTTLQKVNKSKTNIASKFNNCNTSMLTKGLLCLSMLGAVALKSCEPNNIINNEINTEIDDSIILEKEVNNILNTLGLFIEPNKSIRDINTLSFNSDKNEQFYFKFDYISDSSVSAKQIKFDSNLNRGNARLTFLPSDSGLEIIKMTDYYIKNLKIVPEGNSVKCYILENEEWLENSTLRYSNGTLINEYKDGSAVKFFDIKNNEDFPENLYFEQPEEIDDTIIFG